MRRRQKAKVPKMTPAVVEQIEAALRQEWSPEQIAGRLQATDGLELSPERIYQHIRADQAAGCRLYQHLRPTTAKNLPTMSGSPDIGGGRILCPLPIMPGSGGSTRTPMD